MAGKGGSAPGGCLAAGCGDSPAPVPLAGWVFPRSSLKRLYGSVAEIRAGCCCGKVETPCISWSMMRCSLSEGLSGTEAQEQPGSNELAFVLEMWGPRFLLCNQFA